MKRWQKGLLVGVLGLLVLVWLGWRFLPVRVLQDLRADQVASIEVENGINGDVFSIEAQEDIVRILDGIQSVSFRRKEVTSSERAYWYRLTFVDGAGTPLHTLLLQNRQYVRRGTEGKWSVFLHCRGELAPVGELLERREAALFPNYDRDPDFPYS